MTKQDNMIIKAAVDAIRSVSLRFDEANKKTPHTSPHILLQINHTDELFTIQLSGCTQSPASGRTLDEAFENLTNNPDAAFLRKRAQTLMDKAQELMDEAAKMDGATPHSAAKRPPLTAEAALAGLKAMTEGGAE